MDVDHIPAGVDFAKHLESQVGSCELFLALIGRTWLDVQDGSGRRRIDDPDDFVAIEIAAALSRGIPLIPVLIDGAAMPNAASLPDRLKPLALRNAIEIRNTQFGSDAGRLIEKIRLQSGRRVAPGRAASLLAVALFAAGFAGWWVFGRVHEPVETAKIDAKAAPNIPAAATALAQSLLPVPGAYCDDLKRVIEERPHKFEGLLGRKFGDNDRIAKIPLSEWEDCIVFMEGRFNDTRRYACTLHGFADLAAVEKAGEDAANGLKAGCLTKWAANRLYDPEGWRRSRLVGLGSEATITFTPVRPMTDPKWSLQINVE